MTGRKGSAAPTSIDRRAFLRQSTIAAGVAGGLTACSDRPGDPPVLGLADLVIPAGRSDQAWDVVRALFPLRSDLVYMNNASLGLPPGAVVESVADGYRLLSREPLRGKQDLQATIADRVVPELAALMGADPDEIALTRNATEALYLQSTGLRLAPGDEVLVTTQEHPAGSRPWSWRAARHGIRVRELFVPSPLTSATDVVERFADAIGPRTRAIAFCHVTRGGHRYPVKALCDFGRARGVACLVDGAQAVGQFPIDLHDLGCDAYAASLHKWMLGPAGTGFLYVRRDARTRVDSLFEPDPGPDRPGYEPGGTADFPVRAALSTALEFVGRLGLDRVEARCRYLSNHLRGRLDGLSGCTVLSGPPELSAPGSTIFEVEGVDPLAAVPLLEEQIGTHIDEHVRDGHQAIRVSTHVYNTTAEIDRVVDALDRARS